jgi:flagellar biosynthesis GTPase FlhF
MDAVGNKFSQVGNIAGNKATNLGTATGLVEENPWIKYGKMLGIILLIAFLGFNLYSYLKFGTNAISYFFMTHISPILSPIGKLTRPITRGFQKTADLTKSSSKSIATQGKADIDMENEQDSESDSEEEEEPDKDPLDLPKPDPIKEEPKPKENEEDKEAAEMQKNMDLETEATAAAEAQEKATTSKGVATWKREKAVKKKEEPEPDSAILSEVQKGRKKGWCYIGTDRGYRTCMKVQQSDLCMSGKIFDSEDVCKNPNLR